jgi:hypothetical protein
VSFSKHQCAPFRPPQAHVRMLVAINRPYAAEDESVFRFTTLPVRAPTPGLHSYLAPNRSSSTHERGSGFSWLALGSS